MSEQEVFCDSVDGADSEEGGVFFAVVASETTLCTTTHTPMPTLMGRMRWKLRERSIRQISADPAMLFFTFSATGHPTLFINIYRTISLLREPKCGRWRGG